MVIFMKDEIWNLFKTTGEIKYYLLAKKIEGGKNGIKENRRPCSRGDSL